MRLSTSSFSRIISVVGVFVLICFLYNVLVVLFPIEILPRFPSARSEWEAQYDQFIENEDVDSVFAGSSLSNALSGAYFPPNTAKLAFSGGSAITACELVLKSEKEIQFLIVETNVLHRPSDEKFVAEMAEKQALRKWIPSFRSYNRPFTYFSEIIGREATSRGEKHLSWAQGKERPTEDWDTNRVKMVENYSQSWDLEEFRANAWRLRRALEEIAEQGTKVILVRLPVHDDLLTTEYEEKVTAIHAEVFAGSGFEEIYLGNDGLFWSDGIHLVLQSGYRVLLEVAEGAKKMDPEFKWKNPVRGASSSFSRSKRVLEKYVERRFLMSNLNLLFRYGWRRVVGSFLPESSPLTKPPV